MKYLLAFALLTGCSWLEKTPVNTSTTTSSTTTTVKAPEMAKVKLSWNTPSNPEREAWSAFLIQSLNEQYDSFSKASDSKDFCPKFSSLTKDQKINLWAEILVWMMYYESGWSPVNWMTEKSMGIDAVTGKQVKSEGLLQMSYQDTQWHKFCTFDWSKDKLLKQDDPKKTIFNPITNMDCGVKVLAKQIASKGAISLKSSVYWSVIKIDGKYSKLPQIMAKTKALPFCK